VFWNYVHCYFQLGFSWTVYFSIRKKKNWRQAALNWPWFSCCYKPQNASDCISGPLFFKIFQGACPQTPPLGDSRSISAWCQAPVTLHWELATQKFLESTAVSPLGPFHRPKWQISLPFYILEQVKSLPFHVSQAWKRYPFRAEPSRIGHHREYPPPRELICPFWRSKKTFR